MRKHAPLHSYHRCNLATVTIVSPLTNLHISTRFNTTATDLKRISVCVCVCVCVIRCCEDVEHAYAGSTPRIEKEGDQKGRWGDGEEA